uniref:Sodium/nucleoside cotransporter n=1 Tax=Parastrongyloides trichosuri TaxID=131310 RepID=A0A0N4Z014_PARTI
MEGEKENDIDKISESELKYITCTNDENYKKEYLKNIEPQNEVTKEEVPRGKIKHFTTNIKKFHKRNNKVINGFIYSLLLIGYHIYLAFAVLHNTEKAKYILIITGLFWFVFLCVIGRNYLLIKAKDAKICNGQTLRFYLKRKHLLWERIGKNIKFQAIFYGIIFIGIVIYLERDTKDDRTRLQGLAGLAFFIFFMFLFSNSRSHIKWNTVINGYLIQLVMALIVLRFEIGALIFEKISNEIVRFLSVTYKGTDFVYGFLSSPPAICGMNGIFAFKTLQVIVFFNTVVITLNHFNIIPTILKYLSGIIRFILGTTATESFNACACVLFGMTEGPIMIKSYMPKMTLSELHAMCCSGFSCIAGSLFAAYISLGACPSYLLSSSILSAPGSLAASKLLFPETEVSCLQKESDLVIDETEGNLLEKISTGAVVAAGWVVAIVANLMIFLAILQFFDNSIYYLGDLVGVENLSFSLLLGYMFYPLAYIMGVSEGPEEVLRVAKLMGTKTFLNEFIAYQKLGELVSHNPSLLSPKSTMIATFALCGFSNISSIGVQLAVLGNMAPTRKVDLAKVMVRSLIAGSISTFWTATLAGKFFNLIITILLEV